MLTAGEHAVAQRILALDVDAGLLYARLTGRRRAVFADDELSLDGVQSPEAARDRLLADGLLDRHVPWADRLAATPVARLADACRALGSSSRGPRALLEARLADRPDADTRSWVRVRHRALLLRLARWSTLRRDPDRAAPVLERMGRVRWPSYPLTPGPLLRDRRALRSWEAAIALTEAPAAPEALLDALAERHLWPQGRLSPAHALIELLMEHGQRLERTGQPAAARAVYERLAITAPPPPAELVFRLARTWEATHDGATAWEILADGRHQADPVGVIGLARAERRLARALGRGFRPEIPLRAPPTRTLRLPGGAPSANRPTWEVAGQALHIEAAVVGWLAAHGRQALHVEGALWSTLFSLLFVDALFAPVPGALPVPRLSGPLDLGRPGFAEPRRPWIEAARADVRAGRAAGRLTEAWTAHEGARIAGVHWELATLPQLVAIIDGLGGEVLDAVLVRLLDEGWSARSGLPDLVVLPGDAVNLAARPSRLRDGLVLVEVKGPTDAVRDAQAVWFDRLLAAGAQVEIWQVEAR